MSLGLWKWIVGMHVNMPADVSWFVEVGRWNAYEHASRCHLVCWSRVLECIWICRDVVVVNGHSLIYACMRGVDEVVCGHVQVQKWKTSLCPMKCGCRMSGQAAHFPQEASIPSCRALRHKLCHFPGAKCAGGDPKISILMPVLILGWMQHGPQGLPPYCAILVQRNPVLQISPCPVNGLGAGFDKHCLLGAWDLALDDPDVVWGAPLPLAVLLHPLFGMDNFVMNDPRHLALVAFGCIGVQDHLLILQPCFRQRYPFNLTNGAWPRRSSLRHLWVQAVQD